MTTDTELYIQRLAEANPLREPVLRSAIAALRLPPGSHGLDAGCGIGLQALLLAEAVGAGGQITGVDILPDLLTYAATLVSRAGLAERIRFQQSDISQLPFADDHFDWVWSADCVGYPAGDLLPVLRELLRVVKPGGSIILLGWSAQQLLPGYPLLEAWLNANCSSYQPYLKDIPPEQHFLRAPQAFHAAGLVNIEAQTFAGTVQATQAAPLAAPQRTALKALLDMLWQHPAGAAGDTPAAWRDYLRLSNPDSPDFILDQPGYYAFFTCSLFRGTVPG